LSDGRRRADAAASAAVIGYRLLVIGYQLLVIGRMDEDRRQMDTKTKAETLK